jgi:hypothetical protein
MIPMDWYVGDRNRWRKVAVSAVAIAIVSIATPAVPASAAPVKPTPANLVVTGVVQSGFVRLKADGTVDPESTTGVKVEMGARVSLQHLDTKDAKAGDLIPIRTLASATTDASGEYRLALAPDSDLLAAAAANDGWVNFQVDTVVGQHSKVEWLPRHWNGSTWDAAGRVEFAPDQPLRTLMTTDRVTGKSLEATVQQTSSSASVSPQIPTCFYFLDTTYTSWTKILEFHNQRDTDSAWAYGTTADTDVEVGVQVTPTSSWTISGTAHVGNSTGASIQGATPGDYDRYPMTFFEFQQGHYTCTGEKHVVASRWLGGFTDTGGVPTWGCYSSPQSSYRLQHLQGSNYQRFFNRASKLYGAADLGFVSLGATSGYSSHVAMAWTFARNWAWVCGNNDYENYAGIIYIS